MGFGHVFKVPVVDVSTSVENPWTSFSIGNSDNLAVTPNSFVTSFDETIFWDRLKNVFSYYWYAYLFHVITDSAQTKLMRKYLSPDMPNIRDIERNVALILVNRHPLMHGVKPITAALIEVSGLHIDPNGPKLSLVKTSKIYNKTICNIFIIFTFIKISINIYLVKS